MLLSAIVDCNGGQKVSILCTGFFLDAHFVNSVQLGPPGRVLGVVDALKYPPRAGPRGQKGQVHAPKVRDGYLIDMVDSTISLPLQAAESTWSLLACMINMGWLRGRRGSSKVVKSRMNLTDLHRLAPDDVF
jgi:hypothetical protein